MRRKHLGRRERRVSANRNTHAIHVQGRTVKREVTQTSTTLSTRRQPKQRRRKWYRSTGSGIKLFCRRSCKRRNGHSSARRDNVPCNLLAGPGQKCLANMATRSNYPPPKHDLDFCVFVFVYVNDGCSETLSAIATGPRFKRKKKNEGKKQTERVTCNPRTRKENP